MDGGRLGRFLRPLPGRPGLAFDAVEFLQFEILGLVEVADGRLAPQFTNLFEVVRDTRLRHADTLSDRRLREPLDVEVGNLFAAAQEVEFFRVFSDHLSEPVAIRPLNQVASREPWRHEGRIGPAGRNTARTWRSRGGLCGGRRGRDSFGVFSRELFVPRDDHVAIQRIELHQECFAAELLGGD